MCCVIPLTPNPLPEGEGADNQMPISANKSRLTNVAFKKRVNALPPVSHATSAPFLLLARTPSTSHGFSGFGKRTRELVPFMREAILFSTLRRTLAIDIEGRILPGTVKLKGHTAYRKKSEEIAQIFGKSEFVGRWLAASGSPTTIYSMLGVRP